MIIKNFIVFEGIDGAGTTTQLHRLKNFISEEKLFITAEPTSKETGLFLRRLLKGEFSADSRTAALLFAADRAEHIFGKGGVKEQSEEGKIVASDRYFFSTLAYQGGGEAEETARLANSTFPLPELVFYFKINPEVSIKRVLSRGGNLEIYEKLDFQKKTAALFDKIFSEYDGTEKGKGMKIVTIDAEKSMDEIETIIKAEIKKTLGI